MIFIVKISECYCSGRACLGTCCLVFIFFNFTPFFIVGLVFCGLVSVKTEAAFFNNASHAWRYLGAQHFFHSFGPFRIPPVKIPCMIRACPHAIPATKTACIDLTDNSCVIAIVSCNCRADRDTWRMTMIPFPTTLLAWPWHIHHFSIRKGFAIG